jgi:hypothetical protein
MSGELFFTTAALTGPRDPRREGSPLGSERAPPRFHTRVEGGLCQGYLRDDATYAIAGTTFVALPSRQLIESRPRLSLGVGRWTAP